MPCSRSLRRSWAGSVTAGNDPFTTLQTIYAYPDFNQAVMSPAYVEPGTYGLSLFVDRGLGDLLPKRFASGRRNQLVQNHRPSRVLWAGREIIVDIDALVEGFAMGCRDLDRSLLGNARSLRSDLNDAALLNLPLSALMGQHRAAEIDAGYAVYDEQPFDEADEGSSRSPGAGRFQPSISSPTRLRNSAAGAPSTKAWSKVRESTICAPLTTEPSSANTGTSRTAPTPRMATCG